MVVLRVELEAADRGLLGDPVGVVRVGSVVLVVFVRVLVDLLDRLEVGAALVLAVVLAGLRLGAGEQLERALAGVGDTVRQAQDGLAGAALVEPQRRLVERVEGLQVWLELLGGIAGRHARGGEDRRPGADRNRGSEGYPYPMSEVHPCQSRGERTSEAGDSNGFVLGKVRAWPSQKYPEVSLDSVGLKSFHEFDEANATWPRGDRPAAIREAATEFRARFATPENRISRDSHGRHRLRRLPAEVRVRRRRQGPEPLRQHHQPPPGRPVRGLRRPAADARLRADGARGPGRGAVLRAADRAAGRVPLLQGAGDDLEPPRRGPRRGRPVARGRRLRQLRPPPRPGPALRARHDRADRGRERAARAAVPEREADRAAQGVGHLRLAAPDAVGLVRRGRDQGPDRPTTSCWSTATSSSARAWPSSGPPATPTATTRCASTPTTASGSPPRTASAPTTGTRSLSKIPGVRKSAEFFGREVILNSNTLEDSIDQYDSMIKEKALADPQPARSRASSTSSRPRRWPSWKRQWPVVADLHATAGINSGTIERPG